jgi:hypothetical protein
MNPVLSGHPYFQSSVVDSATACFFTLLGSFYWLLLLLSLSSLFSKHTFHSANKLDPITAKPSYQFLYSYWCFAPSLQTIVTPHGSFWTMTGLYLACFSTFTLLTWLMMWLWRQRQDAPPKHQTFAELHIFTAHYLCFTVTPLRAINPPFV